ncbi:hypothetical protein FGSG_03789 [Fusarium graminearum PH-1]|uniref:Chromosome 2, complete genome n=1 Tax=Gibberella zeae (strain ATCC MYA-4620 / CBS 123657 / FGSC 9075 / NRRL 31084 / PH-1) TaxID=229533 RepID=I1RIZ2_GIBZE|nr:hypothetical protein FGSG_03789 [Fusarium graminearum PH-1]ESU09399.1 hypothetical protein FGSG_03789 [Fusarium graminearum PH-1]CAF3660301.1 unnamed protein product [Fusarium graminearum]CEF78657.1 unnamed protein product [Fusarium graminearum]|eukprot:XP_011321898.1 hypothetical protein FGSG_03789 [Fusarium graminearum PH-1]
MSTTSNVSTTFTCFANLPTETRLQIWETAAAREQDAAIHHCAKEYCLEYCLEWPDQPISHAMAETCRESLEVIRNTCIDTIFMPLHPKALARLESLDERVDAIATLWPEQNTLKDLQACLMKRVEANERHRTKTIYIGISAIVCDYNTDLGGLGFKVYDLDDTSFPQFLAKVATSYYGRRLHASNECFIKKLKVYWKENEVVRELRETWDRLRPGKENVMPVLKPVVIFADFYRLFIGTETSIGNHQRSNGLYLDLSRG